MNYSPRTRKNSVLRRVISYLSVGLAVGSLTLLALATFLADWSTVPSTALTPRLSGPQNSNSAPLSRPDKALPPDKVPPADTVIVGQAVQFDVSKPLRDIVLPPEKPATTIREMGEPGETEGGFILQDRPVGEDTVVQRHFGAVLDSPMPAMPSPIANFAGLTNIDGVYPPDTNGDVGPNHYVQWVNLHFQVFNKSGTSVYGPTAGNIIWSGFGGPCETRNDGDPVVLYDSFADRWLMTQFTAAAPYGECVAVSVTGDPTGAYYRYFFSFSNTIFYDYPKLGVWPDGYYLSANRFSGVNFVGASAIVLDRSRMLNGQSATYQEFQTSPTYGSLLPADHDGLTPPPTGSPNFFTEIGATALHLWRFHVDWATPANSTFTGPTSMTVAAFTQLCAATRNCIPQNGTSQRLDAIGDRLMHRLVYRNFGDHEALAVNHTVDSGGNQAAVRWYEIRNPNGAATIYQQGTYAPDATHRWMGSLAFDGAGNMALGYSVSSATLYPGIRYTGRLVTDTLGQMPQGETPIITGTGAQTGSGARWGDYSNISIDPVDDCTFWYTNEYLVTTGTAPWVTRIASFKFPSCTPTLTPWLTVNSINPSDTGGNGNGIIEPGESIRLDISLNNGGNVTATSVSGVVASMTGFASMLHNTSGYPNIGPGVTLFNTIPYTFAVSTQLTCGQPLTLALTATYNISRTTNYTFSLPTGARAVAANFQNFDGVTAPTLPAGWTTTASGSGVAWVTSNTTSDSAPNNAFAPNPAGVGESNLVSPVFTPTTAAARLTFRNNYDLETGYDGAVLEIRIGAGAFTDIVAAGGSFVTGGYNGTISTDFSNPLAGRAAWTGNSGGYITTTVNLPASTAGQSVQLRWRLGTDTIFSAVGQRIDSITLSDGIVCAAYLAPHTYADPALVCAGNAPCYLTPQAALNGVANNGIVTILGTHVVAATLTSGNTSANNVTIDGTGTLNWTGAASPLLSSAAGNVTVKGLTVTNASTIFSQTGSGTLTAYANTFASFTTAYSGSGSHNIGHNYWGTAEPLAGAPAGFSASEWAARLGAPVASWSEGIGSATLVTGANTATLNGGSGTAVIVSHGRGQVNAPFGNGVAPYVNQMCSDFYDLFTVNGSGTWTAQIPVDNMANCNANTLTPRRVAWITTLAQCSPATNTACWNALALARVSVSGQNLLISNLTVAELGGTPFVAGDPSGADPTALSLTSLTAQNHGDPASVVIAGILILLGAGVSLAVRRRRLA